MQRMEIVDRNPCDRLERPKVARSPPRGLSADEVRRLLAVIPDTPAGLRKHALVLTLVLTDRRREEVFRLTAGDVSLENGVPYYRYRGKGGKDGKTGRRELLHPAYEALCASLRPFGRELEDMVPTRFALADSGG
jgi:site-specific recombinase XerD